MLILQKFSVMSSFNHPSEDILTEKQGTLSTFFMDLSLETFS